jgi:hypothetical protein
MGKKNITILHITYCNYRIAATLYTLHDSGYPARRL